MAEVSDYPYDPTARVEELEGLDKLRAVRDRMLARQLMDLHRVLEQATASGDAARWLLEERARAERQEHERLNMLGARALAGELGREARELANEMLLGTRANMASLRAFERALATLRAS